VKTFFGETLIFGKMPNLLENFRPFLHEKRVLRSTFILNHPCRLTSTAQQRTKTVGESWTFHKTSACWKTH